MIAHAELDGAAVRAEPTDLFAEPVRQAPAQPRRNRRALLAVSLAVIWILVCYFPTATAIVSIWYRSPTFAHGFLVLPIVLWLIWRERSRLVHIPVVPCFPALLLLGAIGFGWLLADVAEVAGGMHFMLVAMIPASVWAITGTAMVRALIFPLCYLFFAVPFGEFMVPTLMDWTANSAIAALKLTGIPVFREGLTFSTPTAHWSVVEECSGINYLIASVVIGILYTYLTYRSTLRRVVFVGLFALIPLIANGIRVYLIVLIAYLTNNRLATGIDHIWLGWVLFGIVMLLLFWAASFWREDNVDVTTAPSGSASAHTGATPTTDDSRVFVAVAATILVVSVWRPLAVLVDNAVARHPVQLAAIEEANGWRTAGAHLVNWEPDYAGFSSRRSQVFSNGGEHVGVSLVFYRNQDEHRKLITSTNQLVKSRSAWRVATRGRAEAEIGKERLSVKTTEFTDGNDRIVAWHWYRVDGRITSSDVLAKVYIALSKLRGQGDDSALVVIYTRKKDSSGSENAVLADFAAGMGEAVQRTLSEAEAR